MALLGEGFNPNSMLIDYSGAVKAQQGWAGGMQNMVSGIASAAGDLYKQKKDEQKSQISDIKTASDRIDGILKAFPDQAPQFQMLAHTLNDQNIPIVDRWNAAKSVTYKLEDAIKFHSMSLQDQAAARATQTQNKSNIDPNAEDLN